MPQEEKSLIRSLLDPTIVLDEMSYTDIEEGTNPEYPKEGRGAKEQKRVGNNFPLIIINDYTIQEDELERLKIWNNGFLPTISISMNIMEPSTFISTSIPKDGDRINLFIRSRDDLFKPIRNDYVITSVSSTKSQNSQGSGGSLSIKGELFIPTINDERINSIKASSYDALQTIAQELGLGFASNDTATNDEQTWICPNDTYKNWIQSITGNSWKDEESFFQVFVDVYYHLNFVNANNQFSDSVEIDDALLDTLLTDDSLEGEEISAKKDKKVFTNIEDKRGTPNFIKRYKLVNQSSHIAKKYGYKMHCEFFEQNSLQKWDIYSEPLIVQGSADDKITLRGKAGEDYYKSQIKRRWSGIQYSLPEHNVHEKYIYAGIHNLMNNKELEKLQVHIEVPRANFNIYRCERIPCIFVSTGDPMKAQFLQSEETREADDQALKTPGGPAIDKFYTGFYMIQGTTFTYEARNEQDPTVLGNFYEDVILTRRVWPAP